MKIKVYGRQSLEYRVICDALAKAGHDVARRQPTRIAYNGAERCDVVIVDRSVANADAVREAHANIPTFPLDALYKNAVLKDGTVDQARLAEAMTQASDMAVRTEPQPEPAEE